MTPTNSLMQVGVNLGEQVVKVRVPDDKSPGGWLVVVMSAAAARELAERVDTLVPGSPLRLSNGVRWSEHVLPDDEVRTKIAEDLRRCADAIGSNGFGGTD